MRQSHSQPAFSEGTLGITRLRNIAPRAAESFEFSAPSAKGLIRPPKTTVAATARSSAPHTTPAQEGAPPPGGVPVYYPGAPLYAGAMHIYLPILSPTTGRTDEVEVTGEL